MMDEEHAAERVTCDSLEANVFGDQTVWPRTGATLRVVVILVVVAAALWTLYELQGVLLLCVLSVFFTYLIAPSVTFVEVSITGWIRHSRMRRSIAIGIVYGMLFGSCAGGVYALTPVLANQLTQFGQQVPTYAMHVRDVLQAWRHFVDLDRFPQQIRQGVDKTLDPVIDAATEHLSYGLAGLLELFSYVPRLILIPILAFFLLRDSDTFRRTALLALPAGHMRRRGAALFEEVNVTLAAYVRAVLLACVCVALICTAAFALIAIPYPLLLGLCVGLLEFIPLVGPFIAACGVALIASFHSVGQAATVLSFLGVLRVLQDYVIYPRLVGQSAHLHPLAVILAVLCGAQLAGVAGIVLAIPAAAVMSTAYRHWLAYRGSSGLVAELLQSASADK